MAAPNNPQEAATQIGQALDTKDKPLDKLSNEERRDILNEVTDIMRAGGYSGNDRNSRELIAELEKNGTLGNLMIVAFDDDVDANSRDKKFFEELAAGKTDNGAYFASEGTRLAAQGVATYFGPLDGLDARIHDDDDGKDFRAGEIEQGDLRTFAAVRLADDWWRTQSDGSYQHDQLLKKLRPEVDNVLVMSGDAESKSGVFQRLAAGESVNKGDIEKELQSGANLDDKQKAGLKYLVDHWSKIVGVADGKPTTINNSALDKYASYFGTSRSIAAENATLLSDMSDGQATDRPDGKEPGKQDGEKPANDEKKDKISTADATKQIEETLDGIGKPIDKLSESEKAKIVDEISAIMDRAGLTGTDDASKDVVAQLAKDNKLSTLAVLTFDKEIDFDERSSAYFQKLAEGKTADSAYTAKGATQLAALGVAQYFSAVDGLDARVHTSTGEDKREGLTQGDLRTWGGVALEDITILGWGGQDEQSHKHDVLLHDLRPGVESLLTVTAVQGHKSNTLNKLAAGEVVTKKDIESELKSASDLAEAEKAALKYMVDHYDKILGVSPDTSINGITNKVLDEYALYFGTTRQIALANQKQLAS